MEVTKAVITVAGKGQRTLPLQTLIDRDGSEKSVLTILIEETIRAGIEEIGLVIRPGDQDALKEVAGDHAGRLHFIEQKRPLGYAHAIYCAADFVATDPFLHLVGDHVYISRTEESCTQQLVQMAKREACAVSAIQATHEKYLPHFGAIGGKRVPGSNRLYQIDTILEKPTPTQAEQQLMIPGLRHGNYLCFFGMHVFTPTLMPILAKSMAASDTITLADALTLLSKKEQYLGFAMQDWRYDLGEKYGLMTAQMALALSGSDRDFVLTQLLELMANRVIGK